LLYRFGQVYAFFSEEPLTVLEFIEKYLKSFFQKNEHMFKKMNFITSKGLNVLHFLLVNPMEQFHEREIVRRTGVSVGAVNQILRKLHEAGLVEKDKRGRTNLYKANLKSPVARQFKILFNVLTLSDLINKVKQVSERIVLFGSCAEGTDVEDSDIDLFVLTSDTETVQHEVRVYEQKIDRRLSPIIIDSSELAKMKKRDKPLYERIVRGIVLWERE
jgi:predicted nucleotidyltransferase